MKNPACNCFLLFLLITIGTRPAFSQSSNILNTADSLYTLHNWKSAKERYVTYLKDTSVNTIAWNRLGACNYNLGAFGEAVKNYQRALSYNPPPQIRNIIEARLARTYAAMNQPGQALDWLDKAATSGYTNLKDLDTLADFNKIRTTTRFTDIYKKVKISVFPCLAEPRSQDFDFWIGEWDVYQTSTRNLAGHSVVQPVSGGCAVLENWTSTGSHSGKSLNYYDPQAGKWEQDWVGSGGDFQHYLNGEYKDGMMHFTYSNSINGKTTTGNFIFYNVNKDTVRQYQDVTDKDGKIISISYDLTYVRKK